MRAIMHAIPSGFLSHRVMQNANHNNNNNNNNNKHMSSAASAPPRRRRPMRGIIHENHWEHPSQRMTNHIINKYINNQRRARPMKPKAFQVQSNSLRYS